MHEFDVKHIMKKLSNERPIFHSEDDFKFALAKVIQSEYPESQIRLEFPCEFDQMKSDENSKNSESRAYIDILVIIKGNWIPIELKYKTKMIDLLLDHDEFGEEYNLTDQKAYNQSCYNFIKDISRIEKFKRDHSKFKEGYAILLTNNERYKKGPISDCCYSDFSISENSVKQGKLEYGECKDKEKYPPISLTGRYEMKWNEYSNLTSSNFDLGIFLDEGYENSDKFFWVSTQIRAND